MDISIQNFETDLINASVQQPVLLDIWAPWCGPCKQLGPVLDRVEQAYGGRFKLAKLNSDDQPEIAGQLSQMFGVRSIPFCVLFKDGQPVDGFVGALPEAQIREFLDRHVAPAGEEAPAEEEAETDAEPVAEGPEGALERLQEAVAIDPANDDARYEYLRALMGAGRVAEARRAFEPVGSKVMLDSRLSAVGHWIAAGEKAAQARTPEALAAAVAANKRDFDARFEIAQTHFAAQRFTAAMDELLEIVMRDKAWKEELARKTYVAILELMTVRAEPKPAAAAAASPKGALEIAGTVKTVAADPVVDQYRRKLSMALF
jgi:putative thioredoxin